MAKAAFIGLGVMGQPMAGHLLAGGHELTVYTRTKSRAKPLTSRGAKWSGSAAEAGAHAGVVFICVPDTPDVEAVITGDKGVADGVKRGTIIVDHSTISPSATRVMAKDLATRGIKLLDAPISGGDVGAKNATLSIMVGGDKAAF